MKKMFFFLVLILILLPLTTIAADGSGVRIDGGIGLTGSIYSSFVSVKPEVLYDFGLVAVGGGVDSLFGLTFSDIYIAPYAEVELLWFYLAGGAIFELKEPEPNAEKAPDGYMSPTDSDSGINPYVVLGANGPIVPIGPGHLGGDIYFGVIPTATPVQVVEGSENFLSDIIGTIILSLFSAAFDLFKLGGSIYYTATF